MISLLNIGSSKRALKAGILYSLVVFSVYFLSGFGLFKVIQSFTLLSHYIYIGAGVLVLFLGVTQFIDVFLPGKFISLRIPVKAKPIIEKIASKGTLPAVILLGLAVSLFELPCTGGVYIGILTLMAQKGTFAWGYLLLYNLIFILPLLLITLIIYKGTRPETIERWSQNEKSWMKIASGAVMIALGIYILMSTL
jgi:cytochrome c biogenesis protein CcdA